MNQTAPTTPQILLPRAPCVVAMVGRAQLLTTDGELQDMTAREAAGLLRAGPAPILVHAPATLKRLGMRSIPCLDLLELFAFAKPAVSVAPTPRGLALALDLPKAITSAGLLPDIAQALLAFLAAGRNLPGNRDAPAIAARMGQAGWGWAPFVLAALGAPEAKPNTDALRVWKSLPEWMARTFRLCWQICQCRREGTYPLCLCKKQ